MNEQKSRALINFKKSRSLLDKIIKMTENGEYCIDIMQHNLAVIGLLKSAHQSFLAGHLDTCFKNAFASKNKKLQDKMVEEILKVSKMANK